MKKDLASILLTRQEFQIMKVIWEGDAATVKAVCDAISQRKATAYTTVMTFMRILEDKGALVHAKSGRTYVYRPLLSRRQATQNHLRDIIERFFDGCPERLISEVMEKEVKTPEPLGNAKSLLNSQQANGSPKKPANLQLC